MLTEVLEEKLTPEKFVDVLLNFKNSNGSKEQEIYSCIIHNLLTEFQFYRNYPNEQLKRFLEFHLNDFSSSLCKSIWLI